MLNKPLTLTASVAGAQIPKFDILAYSGGLMTVPGWGPVVIELAGLELGEIPVLADHESCLAGIVGHGVATVSDNKLVVSGTVSGTTDAAKKIVDSAKNGFPWQASVGVEVLEQKPVRSGQSITANGRTITAPASGFIFIQKGKLREVSIVGVGCDSATCVAIAASINKGSKIMETEKKEQVQTQVLDEAARVEMIKNLCASRTDGIEAQAINDGWDDDRTKLEILRASRPAAPRPCSAPYVPTVTMLEAALLNYVGMSNLGEKVLCPMAMEMGSRLRTNSLLDLCRAALQAEMIDIPRGRDEMVRAAMSTMSLPNALGNVMNRVLMDAYSETAATWRSFCQIKNVSDFKTGYGIRPSYFGNNLEQVGPGGELKHGELGEWLTSFRADTFGKMLSIDRRDIINDNLGFFDDIARGMGTAAMRSLSDLVYTVLLNNTANFFGEDNGNYLVGAETLLSIDATERAITAMRTQRDDYDNDLDLRPSTLLVPPELEITGRRILQSEFIQAAQNLPTGNSLKGAVGLEVEPRLSNSAKFGNSATKTQWYLFAAASASPMIVCFLNGKQTPTIEYFGIDQDVNKLAMSWRVFFDYGAALCDPRAAVKSKGQA